MHNFQLPDEIYKILNQRRNRMLSKSLPLKNNTSQYQEVSLAEFSSMYDAQKFSQILHEENSTSNGMNSELQNLKDNNNKSFAQEYINNRLQNASKYLKKLKLKMKDDALSKYFQDKSYQETKTVFPNISQEVVKRCSQPQSYLLYRKKIHFLPKKNQIMRRKKAKKQLSTSPKAPPNKNEQLPKVNQSSKRMIQRQLQSNQQLNQSVSQQPSQQASSQVTERKRIESLSSVKRRHTASQKDYDNDEILRQIFQQYETQLGLQMKDNFQDRQDCLMQILKIVSIERNLNELQSRSVLVKAMREFLQQELNLIEQISLSQFNVDSSKSGQSELLNLKLNNLIHYSKQNNELNKIQSQIRQENHNVKDELKRLDEWFQELHKFYVMLKEGDMPQQKDAQILFEVKKLEQMWNDKEQQLEIYKFKQLSDQNSQGLWTLQKYEHNRFVKENAKRRKELKNMG